MEERKPGELTTLETRSAAEAQVNKNLRYKQILEVLGEFPDGLTAKEIARVMYLKFYIPSEERNFTAPRLTELGRIGIVEPIGKKKCQWTGRTVTVWGLCNEEESAKRKQEIIEKAVSNAKNEREEAKWN